jgi:hypothetical protein
MWPCIRPCGRQMLLLQTHARTELTQREDQLPIAAVGMMHTLQHMHQNGRKQDSLLLQLSPCHCITARSAAAGQACTGRMQKADLAYKTHMSPH